MTQEVPYQITREVPQQIVKEVPKQIADEIPVETLISKLLQQKTLAELQKAVEVNQIQ